MEGAKARADPAKIEGDASDSWQLTNAIERPTPFPPTRALELINVPFSWDHFFFL